MPIQFDFKTRYIFLDYLLISIALGVLTAFISLILQLPYEYLFKSSISLYVLGSTCFVLLCLSIAYRLKQYRIKTSQIVGSLKIKQLPWITLLIVFYGEQTLTSGVNYLEYYFVNLISPDLVETTVTNLTEGTSHSSEGLLQLLHYLLLMVSLTLVAPITEEFVFRGIFLHRWAVKWGVRWSIILSSLLFGAVHWDIFWFSRAVGSIFIALFYIQTGSLLVPIILHALNNGLVFINLLFHHFGNSAANDLNITSQYIWYGVVNISLAIPVFIYFLKVPQSLQELPYFDNQKKQ